MLTLYQAEWCPYSSAVREILTELGLDVLAKQVEPFPEDRAELRDASGDDSIPTLVTEDGEAVIGTRAIFRYLESQDAWRYAEAHRRRFAEHEDARRSDAVGQLVARFRAEQPGDASPDRSR